jgi:hypothetical protein
LANACRENRALRFRPSPLLLCTFAQNGLAAAPPGALNDRPTRPCLPAAAAVLFGATAVPEREKLHKAHRTSRNEIIDKSSKISQLITITTAATAIIILTTTIIITVIIVVVAAAGR